MILPSEPCRFDGAHHCVCTILVVELIFASSLCVLNGRQGAVQGGSCDSRRNCSNHVAQLPTHLLPLSSLTLIMCVVPRRLKLGRHSPPFDCTISMSCRLDRPHPTSPVRSQLSAMAVDECGQLLSELTAQRTRPSRQRTVDPDRDAAEDSRLLRGSLVAKFGVCSSARPNSPVTHSWSPRSHC